MKLIRWVNLSGGYGNAGMRPEHRLRGRNRSGRPQPLPSFHDSGANAINPRGLGTESPSKRVVFPFRFGWEWSITEALAFLDEPLHSKEHTPQ